MTTMGTKPDPAWTALTDSIKRDLADLPTVSGRALDARLKAHIGRMRRLMAMHEGMMHAVRGPTCGTAAPTPARRRASQGLRPLPFPAGRDSARCRASGQA